LNLRILLLGCFVNDRLDLRRAPKHQDGKFCMSKTAFLPVITAQPRYERFRDFSSILAGTWLHEEVMPPAHEST